MAQENETLENAKNIANAAVSGAEKAVIQKIITPLQKFTEPGDMNIANAPHPIDELKTKAEHIQMGLKNLTEPGDMNTVPHPVEQALASAKASASEKINAIKAAGAVKGTEMATEMATAAIIGSLDPFKKVNAVGEAIEGAADASKAIESAAKIRHVKGELVDDIPTGKGLTLPQAPEAATGIVAKAKETAQSAKNKVLDAVEKVPVFGEVLAPDLSQRISNQVYKENPIRTPAYHDEKHRIGGDTDALFEQHKDKEARANALGKMVAENPEAAKILNRQMSDKDISKLLNTTTNEQLGLPHNPNAVPKLPSPEQQVKIDAQFAELEKGKQALADHNAYLETLSPLKRAAVKLHDSMVDKHGITGGLNSYNMPIDAERRINATDIQSEQIKVIKEYVVTNGVRVVAGAAGATAIALHDWSSTEEKNQHQSERFLDAVNSGRAANVVDSRGYKKDDPIRNAAATYQLAEDSLRAKDGSLSDQAQKLLIPVRDNIANQIATKGPESFGEVSHNIEKNKTAAQDLGHH